MPTGPKGEKRPADVIGTAVRVMWIATDEETDPLPADDGKDPETLPAGDLLRLIRGHARSCPRQMERADRGVGEGVSSLEAATRGSAVREDSDELVSR